MALPTVEKTWQISANNSVPAGTGSGYSRPAFLAIKNILKGFGSSAWTVSGSSNSVTSNMTGTDLLVIDGNVVYGPIGGPHTWIVLRQAGISSKFEIVFDFTTGSTLENFNVVVSPSVGFGVINGGTNGSNTNRPTATDEVVLGTRIWGGNGGGESKGGWWHISQSTDGECTRIFSTWNNYCTSFWIMDKPKLPVAHWSIPWVVGIVGTDASTGTYGSYVQWTDASNLTSKVSTTATGIRMTTEGPGSGPLGKTMTYPDDVTGEAPLTPVGLLATTAPVRGRLGMLFDVWCGINGSGYNAGPTMYPASGTRLFTQVNNLVLPWAGTAAPQWA